ncbi:MAG: ribosome biogenesis GTPase Der [Arenicellales bacterium]|nr:ribosome biogenesis GTPase Der [Arenicellales bacterium]
MKPVISIVGRSNVGKSTLYNRLTQSRDAIVDDLAGVTRDRLVGHGHLGDYPYWVVDTGGYEQTGESGLELLVQRQFQIAIDESDAVIFVVDYRVGLTVGDEEIAKVLRGSNVPIFVAVNKSEGIDSEIAAAEFHQLGIGESIVAISADRGTGVRNLIDLVLEKVAGKQEVETQLEPDTPRIAVLGKPNVGKSTLVNRLLGEERMIVCDQAGTTRDSVYIPFMFDGSRYALIDTAGVKRRARVTEKLERISVVKTLQTLEQAHVVILLVDAREGITDQDASLAGLIRQHGRSMVLAVNKWDGLDQHEKDRVRRGIKRELPFLDSVSILFISARHGSGVGGVMPAVQKAYESAMASLGTAKLNVVLRRAVEAQPPPRVGRQAVKLKYAHQGGRNPPTVVIHGNLLHKVPDSYKRYLASSISKGFKLTGTRVDLSFRTSKNPYNRSHSRAQR